MLQNRKESCQPWAAAGPAGGGSCSASSTRGRARRRPPSGERGTRRLAAGGEGAGRGLQLSERQGAERALLLPEPSAGPKRQVGDGARGAIEGARRVGRRPGQALARALAPRRADSREARRRGPCTPVRPGESGLWQGKESGREGRAGGEGGQGPRAGGEGGGRLDPAHCGGPSPATGNFARVARAGCVEGAANLSAGGAFRRLERAPASGVCLSGFFVSPP